MASSAGGGAVASSSSSTNSSGNDSASLKHLRKIFLEKFVESTVARLSQAELQESFGELKKSMDAKSFNIFMTMVKEKMEGLKPYAQAEFEGLCAEYDLNAKFRQMEDAAAATAASKGAGTASGKQQQKQQQQGEEPSLEGLSAEDLARHRRVAIKKKELAELKQMEEREEEIFKGAEAALKATKDTIRAVYHDLASINPEAQKLIQRCAEN